MNTQILFLLITLLPGISNAQNSGLSNLANGHEASHSTTQALSNHISPKTELEKEFNNSQESTTPAMKKIFEAEVAPNAAYFMLGNFTTKVIDPSDPQAVDSHSEIQADMELFWRYMKFKASNFSTQSYPTLCIQARADTDCADCENLKNSLLGTLSEKFISRGFNIKTGPSITIPLNDQTAVRGEKAFEEYLAKMAGMSLEEDGKTGCESGLYFEVTSNETKNQFGLATFLEIKNYNGRKNRITAHSVLNTSEESASTKNKFKSTPTYTRLLVNHQLVQLFGFKQVDASLAVGNSQINPSVNVHEKYLEIKNVDSFLKYRTFKQIFSEIFPEIPIEERVLKSASVRFALQGVGPETGMVPIDVVVTKVKQSQAMIDAGLRFEILKSNAANDEIVLNLK